MKRAKSALSLRNLANSIQQSIQTTNIRQTKPAPHLKASRSSAQLLRVAGEERQKQREQVDNRVFVLERQIVGVEKHIDETASTVRDYSRELTLYEQLRQQIKDKQSNWRQIKSKLNELMNQEMMIRADSQSRQYNARERIAQQQYYEQLLNTYQQQYPEQHQYLACILSRQQCTVKEEENADRLQCEIERVEREFGEWKKESEYLLNYHKMRHSAKLIRMQMMECEDACDAFCKQHHLPKIREIYCQFFKAHAKRNGVGNQAATEGIDIYICRNGLLQDFGEELRERLCSSQPPFGGFETYLLLLNQLQQVFGGKRERNNQKMHDYYIGMIEKLRDKKEEAIGRARGYRVEVNERMEAIEKLFGNNSIALIECMREENNNQYDLKAIKQRLRQSKQEQTKRIAKIREAYLRSIRLEEVIDEDNKQNFLQQMLESSQEIEEQIRESRAEARQCQWEITRLREEKQELEVVINEAVTTWKERDEAKKKLKRLYRQLQSAKSNQHLQHCSSPPVEPFHQPRSESIIAKHPLRSSNHSNASSILAPSNKSSTLSLSNPYRQLISREMEQYKPVISECKMILSKKVVSRSSHQPNCTDDSEGRLVLESRYGKERRSGKGESSKENVVWPKRTKSYTTTQNKVTKSGGVAAKGKGKMSDSQRISLSNLLLSKFNR